jgi:hypothetical protein
MAPFTFGLLDDPLTLKFQWLEEIQWLVLAS